MHRFKYNSFSFLKVEKKSEKVKTKREKNISQSIQLQTLETYSRWSNSKLEILFIFCRPGVLQNWVSIRKADFWITFLRSSQLSLFYSSIFFLLQFFFFSGIFFIAASLSSTRHALPFFFSGKIPGVREDDLLFLFAVIISIFFLFSSSFRGNLSGRAEILFQ